MSRAIKIITIIISALILLTLASYSEDKQNDIFATTDDSAKTMPIAKNYTSNYWPIIGIAIISMAIPIALFTGAIILIQHKRNAIKKQVTKVLKFCPDCNHQLNSHAVYCEMCGINLSTGKKDAVIPNICPLCKIPMKANSHSCVMCGISLH